MHTSEPEWRWVHFDPLFRHLSDPIRALELQPYSLKPLLRRAMAYESLERYRKAYVDYKTVLQIDTGIQAAHDSVHRSAKCKSKVEHVLVSMLEVFTETELASWLLKCQIITFFIWIFFLCGATLVGSELHVCVLKKDEQLNFIFNDELISPGSF